MPDSTMKGRGTPRNPVNRFAPSILVREKDGWYQEEVPLTRATEIRFEQSRTIITRNQSPDIAFDRSINPYRGCEHGCIYCFARPSHAYWDMSPGLDFETRLIAKTNAATLLVEQLGKRGYQCAPITLGANTDPYQPIEREQRLTRQCLEVLLAHRHPVALITKGALILRDLDLLGEMARQQLVSVSISLTTLDDELKRILEPRAASGQARLRVVQRLKEAGVPVSVICAPMIPMINDMELEQMLEAAQKAGADSAGYILLRLPLEVAPLFEDWLHAHYPQRAEHVLSLIRQCRGGRLNDPRFGNRFRGQGAFAALLAQRFSRAIRRYGLNREPRQQLDCSRFAVPDAQMTLF